jgi:hypothetical protein
VYSICMNAQLNSNYICDKLSEGIRQIKKDSVTKCYLLIPISYPRKLYVDGMHDKMNNKYAN